MMRKPCREHNVDMILSLGGGSVCDYSKGVAASAYYDGDYWDRFWLQGKHPDAGQRILPIGCILTMAGTGSEMNGGSVITDAEHKFKVGHVFDARLMPKFSILNPKYTMTVPDEQMKAGIYDIMNHIFEQYFSDFDDNTSDYLSEGLMRSLVVSSRTAVKNPQDYEARSNIMWTATWALNTLLKCGNPRLDGTHDRSQRGCLDTCPARILLGGRLHGLLQTGDEAWSGQIRAFRRERLERPS